MRQRRLLGLWRQAPIWVGIFVLIAVMGVGAGCRPGPALQITIPTTGSFSPAGLLRVAGVLSRFPACEALVTVNGAVAHVAEDGQFSVYVVADANGELLPIHTELRRASNGIDGPVIAQQEVVVWVGDASPGLTIISPVPGSAADGAEVRVSGFVEQVSPANAIVRLNGALIPPQPDGSFGAWIPVAVDDFFFPIVAELLASDGEFSDVLVASEQLVLVSGPPPTAHVVTPTSGIAISGTSVVVSGFVENVPPAGTELLVNGVAASLASDGSYSVEVPVGQEGFELMLELRVIAEGFQDVLVFAGDPRPGIEIVSPAHGAFVPGPLAQVVGHVVNAPAGCGQIQVNGAVATLDPNGSFAVSIVLPAGDAFPEVEAEFQLESGGPVMRDSTVVVQGEPVLDGALSPGSLEMRVTDGGLGHIEPVVNDRIQGVLDVEALVLAQNPVYETCVLSLPLVGCVQSVRVDATSVSHGTVSLEMDAEPGSTRAAISVADLRVQYDSDGIDCQGEIRADTTTIVTRQDQVPLAGQPSQIDVNQLAGVAVGFSGFDNEFTGGVCDLLQDLVVQLVGDVEGDVRSALEQNLEDPDGAGPIDAPIAAAFQAELAQTNVAGPVGQELGLVLDADFEQVIEGRQGITYRLESGVLADQPSSQAPDLSASLVVPGGCQPWGTTAPSGASYDLGLCISATALNQLLRAEVESGLLQGEITSLDFGSGPVPLTAGLLSLIISEFASLDGATPLTIEFRPEFAPVVTGALGPSGEPHEVQIGEFEADIADPSGTVWLRVSLGMRMGLAMSLDPAGASFAANLSPPPPESFRVKVLRNAIGAEPQTVAALLPQVLPALIPGLVGSLTSFPLPTLIGLPLDGVEVGGSGASTSIYLNLGP